MANPCVDKLAKTRDLSELEIEELKELENQIHDAKREYTDANNVVNSKGLRQRVDEIMKAHLVTSKYNSQRIIEDQIKLEKLKTDIVKNSKDGKSAVRNMFDFFRKIHYVRTREQKKTFF